MHKMHPILVLCGLLACSSSLAMNNNVPDSSKSNFTSSQEYLDSCQAVLNIVHRARAKREAQEALDNLAYESSKQEKPVAFQYIDTNNNNITPVSVTISAITPGIATFVALAQISMQKTRLGILHTHQADSSAEPQTPQSTFEHVVARHEIGMYRKLIEFYENNPSWKALNAGPSSMFMMSEKAFEGHWQAHCAALEQANLLKEQLAFLEKIYPAINNTTADVKDL